MVYLESHIYARLYSPFKIFLTTEREIDRDVSNGVVGLLRTTGMYISLAKP